MTKSFKFYFDFLSPLSRSLYILFERNKVPCEKVSVALRKGEQLKKEFRAINRFRKVPVIHDSDGFKLSETVAIFHYLGRKNIIPYPENPKEIAKIDEFLSWHHNSLLVTTGLIFYNQWIKPFTGASIPPHAMMVNTKSPLDYVVINQSLNDLETLWLRNNKFLVGEEVTFADVIASCELMQIIGMKLYELDGKSYPKVNKWLEEVRNVYNPEFDAAHKIVYKMGKNFNGKPPTSAILAFKVYQYFQKLLK